MQVITWTELIVLIVTTAMAWYAYVFLKYYRGGFVKKREVKTVPAKWVRETPAPSASDVHAQVHELMQSIKDVLTACQNEHLNKTQVMEALGLRLKKNNHLPAEIKSSITLHIVNEFSLQLNMAITEHEIHALW